MTPDRSALLPNRRILGPGMRKAWAGFLVTALAAASTMAPCSGSAFAQQLSAQAAAGQSGPEAAASQSAQQPAGQPAANCPGHPDALGTSRVLALDPAEYPRIGRMQYPDSLPLADKEVVLTFDDGPILPYSDQILDILASQCVKATYFLVGEMARAFPATVRRMYEEGHTIGTHSEDHPTRFGQLPVEKMRHEIDWGISEVSAALGDPKYLAPFFRIPGLARSDVVESELAARGLTVPPTPTPTTGITASLANRSLLWPCVDWKREARAFCFFTTSIRRPSPPSPGSSRSSRTKISILCRSSQPRPT
jgi:hypothetical protein